MINIEKTELYKRLDTIKDGVNISLDSKPVKKVRKEVNKTMKKVKGSVKVDETTGDVTIKCGKAVKATRKWFGKGETWLDKIIIEPISEFLSSVIVTVMNSIKKEEK